MQSQDTEITLGSGRLLALFFGLAVVCAVFFGMGFVLGRNSGSKGSSDVVPGAVAATPISVTTGVAKPTAGKAGATDTASSSDELAFVKAGDKPDAAASSEAPPADAEPSAPAPAPPAASVAAKAAPELKPSATTSGFVVQVAAVSKKDDAEALLGALRKKSYPVFIAGDGGDHLFHVQVGPFSDKKDAQTMRDKLSGDGYNAIVK